jgi:hypothetical protein
MIRYTVSGAVALGALAIGMGAVARRQGWIGIFFIGIGALRAATILWAGKPRKPQPSIRLNLEDTPPESRKR